MRLGLLALGFACPCTACVWVWLRGLPCHLLLMLRLLVVLVPVSLVAAVLGIGILCVLVLHVRSHSAVYLLLRLPRMHLGTRAGGGRDGW